MKRQRRMDTVPEVRLRRELYRRGLRYRVNFRVLPESRRKHDIVFVGPKVVVEVYGCFWHSCPQHGSQPKANARWWLEKLAANRARDSDTEARLAANGWCPIVVWEHDDLADAADRIEAAVRKRQASRTVT